MATDSRSSLFSPPKQSIATDNALKYEKIIHDKAQVNSSSPITFLVEIETNELFESFATFDKIVFNF